jgi:hypothetical protein
MVTTSKKLVLAAMIFAVSMTFIDQKVWPLRTGRDA